MPSFRKDLVSSYYVPSTALGLDSYVIPMNKTDINTCPGYAYILVEEENNNKPYK